MPTHRIPTPTTHFYSKIITKLSFKCFLIWIQLAQCTSYYIGTYLSIKQKSFQIIITIYHT